MLAAHSSGTSSPVTGPAPNANMTMYSRVPATCEEWRFDIETGAEKGSALLDMMSVACCTT